MTTPDHEAGESVKRWDCDVDYMNGEDYQETGRWVLYADYVREVERLMEVLRKCNTCRASMNSAVVELLDQVLFAKEPRT